MANHSELHELRKNILKIGTVRFASGVFGQKHYSNGTVSEITHSSQEIVEIGIDDLMKIVQSQAHNSYRQGQMAAIQKCIQLQRDDLPLNDYLDWLEEQEEK